MDLATAVYQDVALAGLCLLTLGVALAVRRSERRTITRLEGRSDEQTRAGANVRLLEVRAGELAREVEELERAREELLLTDAGIVRGMDLRAALGTGRRPKLVRTPEEVSDPEIFIIPEAIAGS